jgi:membrane-associated protease RseP (regulator of RpoE activity)
MSQTFWKWTGSLASAPGRPSPTEPLREVLLKDPLETVDTEPVETKKAITGAVVIVAGIALLVVARPSAWVTIAIVVGLVLTIMLHEFGHFIMAKRAGMKVTEFFVGFGPRIWSFRRGETEYGVKAIPAGGYVRIIGMNNLEEVDPEDEPRAYRNASTKNKLLTILAGVTVNLLIAYVLLFAITVGNGEYKLGTSVDKLTANSPAVAAGLKPGDRFVAIDGTPIKSWDDLGANVRPNAGKQLAITVERNGQLTDVTATPEDVGGEGKLGVYPNSIRETYSPIEAVPQSFVLMGRATSATFDALGKLVSPSGVEKYSSTVANPNGKNSFTPEERPRSVIGIVADGGDIVGGNIWLLFSLLAMINLFLALVNLIPLPPFDGGHAAVAIYESIASKVQGRRVQVDYRKLIPVAAVVLVAFVALGVSAMYLDVRGIVVGN